jgi:hypothetical protein
MGLLDEVRAQVVTPGTACPLLAVIDGDVELGGELEACVRDHSLPAAAIERALAARGVELGAPAINRHRTGRCPSCRRAGLTW